MIDKKQNKEFRNSDLNNVKFSQFKEFNCEEELTPIQTRMYFLMINGSMPRSVDESLYGWCGRLGLSNSTIFGIFKKNNKNMHLSVAQKIAVATGANAEWVQHGIGEPFKEVKSLQKVEQSTKKYIIEAVRIKPKQAENLDSSVKLAFKTVLEPQQPEDNQDLRKLLTACYESTEGALYATYRMMDPDDKSEFILKFYKALLAEENISLDIDEDTLLLAIFTIEVALYYSRRIMSPESKTELITDIYRQYDSKPEMKQQTLNEYNEYKRRK